MKRSSRKRLLSTLRQGRPGILLDNIRGQFGSAALEGFLTTELYTDRVLQVSQMLSLPTNVLFMISGNNFHPKGDLYRRILTARIDAKTDAPERRTFKIDPLRVSAMNTASGLSLPRSSSCGGS